MAPGWYINAPQPDRAGQCRSRCPRGSTTSCGKVRRPRQPYRDNLVHYNWHWFWHWGTGELGNNGVHAIDICRWGLDVGIPHRVSSSGGRYHFDDDWEFYDSQVTSFEYDDAIITWEGRSCNPFPFYDRGRGATIHGMDGTVLVDRNGYSLYDNTGAIIKQINERAESVTTAVAGGGALDKYHLENFFSAIRDGEALRSPIDQGVTSTLLCHLGNIAQKLGRTLNIDPRSGHVRDDREAMQLWSRRYAPGWEPKV